MKKLALAATAALCLAATPSMAATKKPHTGRGYEGSMRCTSDARLGFILASVANINCTFKRTNGRVETYTGKLRRFGPDVGFTGKASVTFGVYSDHGVPRGGLEGRYSGSHMQATAVGGLAAHVLGGGPGNGIRLRPVSIETSVGIHFAVGLVEMKIDYVGSRAVARKHYGKKRR